MSTIDLGNGQTVPRHHPPEHLVRALDMANASVEAAKAHLRQWLRPMVKMQAPADFPHCSVGPCNAPQMSGIAYGNIGPGDIIDVDERDVKHFQNNLKFTAVSS